jgi:hypothetical protein
MVGSAWKVTGPLPAVSRSSSGSVVQYMYHRRACAPRPRTTVGSAQLSTVPRPRTVGARGLWYVARGTTGRVADAAVPVEPAEPARATVGEKAPSRRIADSRGVTYLTTRVMRATMPRRPRPWQAGPRERMGR